MTTALQIALRTWLGSRLVTAPGVYDAFSALLAQGAGFGALYLSGNALGLHLGLGQPFVGSGETLAGLQAIRRVCDLPVIVDAGAGFGDPVHAAVAMRGLEAAGAAAVHIDDQIYPKRAHYHRGRARLSPTHEVEAKLAAMSAARRGAGTLLIARTDALRAGESEAAAIARCKSYVAAGAEALIVLDLEPDQAAKFRDSLPGVPIFWIGGIADPVPEIDTLEDAGFAVALYPFVLAAAAFDAMRGMLKVLKETGQPAKGTQSARLLSQQALDTIGFDALFDIEAHTTEQGDSA